MAKARIAVLISGTGSNMAALVYAAKAKDCPFEIVLVASNNPDAPGLKLAAGEGIATFAHPHAGTSREAHDSIMHGAITAADADFVALAGYMRILTPGFVAQWQGKMLNIHPSLLPKYKGLHTHQRALEAGDSHGGASVHIVTAELDDGETLDQIPVAVLAGDTAETLAARVLIAEHQLYSRALAAYVTREAQPEWQLDQIRVRAMQLPNVEERTSHGAPGFAIAGGKFFAMFNRDHHSDGITALLVKTSGADEQAMLIDSGDDLYYRPQYYGASGWIGIRLDLGRTDWEHVNDWLSKSWLAVAPPKLRKQYAATRSIADAF
jgi:phosphoribosylglycinamide formyltransferase 1